jgi:hypothetical protein
MGTIMLKANRRIAAAPLRQGYTPPRGTSLIEARGAYERYLALAQAASRDGDKIEMENYYQHADHFFRLMRGFS